MFRRVMLCHDGTDYGRRALKQGAELAISLGAQVHVLALVRSESVDAVVTAAAMSVACLLHDAPQYEAMLEQSIDHLKARGVQASGHIVRGNVLDNIVRAAKSFAPDLIVVGRYPSAGGRRWWSGPGQRTLAESVDCAVLIAVGPA